MTDTVERLRADWKQYRRTQIAELRPYRSGETLNGRVSISAEDRAAGSPKPGDMIARNPKNHQDQWLVAAQYFADNFEDVNDTQMLWDAVAEKNAEIERLRAALDKIINFTEGCRDVSLAAAMVYKIAAGALRTDTKREPAA